MSPEYQRCIQAHYTPAPHLQILSKDPCLPPDFAKPWQMWFCKILVVFWLVFLLSLCLLLLFEYLFCFCLLCCDWFSTCLFNTLCGLRRGLWVAICNVSAKSTIWNTIPTVPGNGIQARVTSSTVEQSWPLNLHWSVCHCKHLRWLTMLEVFLWYKMLCKCKDREIYNKTNGKCRKMHCVIHH